VAAFFSLTPWRWSSETRKARRATKTCAPTPRTRQASSKTPYGRL